MANFVIILISIFLPTHLTAQNIDKYYLGVGGGFSSNLNTSVAVLEKNILLFKDLLDKTAYQKILFGSGTDENRFDVKETDHNSKFDNTDYLILSYFLGNNYAKGAPFIVRHNEIPDLDGSSNGTELMTFLDDINYKITSSGNKSFFGFYYTGHGSAQTTDDGETFYTNNLINLWDNTNISVHIFTEELDKFPEDTQIQIVMVQCYSGGFSQILYKGGDIEKKELSNANRCGFFSQVKTKQAAGCSPDLLKREEYSPYFFAAYKGENEKGEKVNADYNGDGKITSDEAHAYVIISENSRDIPISTSSQLLRDFNIQIVPADTLKDWNFFIGLMDATEKAIAKSLVDKTDPQIKEQQHPYLYLEDKIKNWEDICELSDDHYNSGDELVGYLFSQIKMDIQGQNPNYYNTIDELSVSNEEEIKTLENLLFNHELYPELKSTVEERNNTDSNRCSRVHSKHTKLLRLKYLLDTKLMEKYLYDNKDANDILSKVFNKYKQLKSCENYSFF